MTAAAPSTALATIQPAFTDPERLALAGFLAGYQGLTREAYALDLRQFTSWCCAQSLPLFAVRRADIETFARELEAGAGPGPPSPGGCAPSPGSASTRSNKSSSSIPLPPMSGVRGWMMSRTRLRSIATSSARCWWPPGSARRPSMR
ncbi:MAG TPA: hypothetical protein VGJ54_06195 [Streptosporangiaceae bacterium]|jgi:hypothetical protein